MGVLLQISDAIVQAIRLPEERMERELLLELASALYARGVLSFGKARELAGMGNYELVVEWIDPSLEEDLRWKDMWTSACVVSALPVVG